jgi:methylated-DNA-[protein]-cysteine S-methyltransferase
VFVRHAFAPTSLGELVLVAEDDALAGLYFPGHWYPPSAEAIGERADNDPFLRGVAEQLVEYLDGSRVSFDVPVRTHGNELQEKVWAILREIPFGETTSYGAIALQLGDRNLAQAVGQAVGHNPVSIVIPCHRVVGATGKITGFAGGLERKRALLALEEPAADVAGRLF